jgi:hemolysin activation/secretion protein
MHDFYLNKKNCININYQNYYLQSDLYIVNELFRFGGSNSIRGFLENSLQASFMTSVLSEYRYIISPDLYLHSILDYCYYQDKSTNKDANLLGIGFGIGVQTKNGLLKISLANGSAKAQKTKFNNTIITICYTIKF